MKNRIDNYIEICEKHGYVYNMIMRDHSKPALQKKIKCRCDEFDSSYEAKIEKYECKVNSCKNSLECIFHKKCEPDVPKLKRPILIKFTKQNKKLYGCLHYNWDGEPLNEEK